MRNYGLSERPLRCDRGCRLLVRGEQILKHVACEVLCDKITGDPGASGCTKRLGNRRKFGNTMHSQTNSVSFPSSSRPSLARLRFKVRESSETLGFDRRETFVRRYSCARSGEYLNTVISGVISVVH